jgi:hypothetical protein
MDALELKRTLDSSLRPGPNGELVDTERAWLALRRLVGTPPAGTAYQELCFSVDKDELTGVTAQVEHPQQLLVYLGWLIDAEKGSAWSTIEITLYYRYPLSADLAERLDDLRRHSFDTALEGDPADPDLAGTFIRRVDAAEPVWTTLRDRPIDESAYTCVVSTW